MRHELIDKYIFDVTKTYPRAKRNELDTILRERINLIYEEKYPNLDMNEKRVREVLAQMGTPEKVAYEYLENGTESAIPMPAYVDYKKLLNLGVFVTILSVVLMYLGDIFLVNAGEFEWFELFIIAKDIALAFAVPFTVVTLAFMIFASPKRRRSFKYIDSLNTLRVRPKRLSTTWQMFRAFLTFLLASILMFFGGKLMPILAKLLNIVEIPLFPENGYLENLRILTVLFLFFQISIISVKLIDRRFTKRVTNMNYIFDILSIIALVLILYVGNGINPEYIRHYTAAFADNRMMILVIENIGAAMAIVMTILLLIDMLNASIRYSSEAEKSVHEYQETKDIPKDKTAEEKVIEKDIDEKVIEEEVIIPPAEVIEPAGKTEIKEDVELIEPPEIIESRVIEEPNNSEEIINEGEIETAKVTEVIDENELNKFNEIDKEKVNDEYSQVINDSTFMDETIKVEKIDKPFE